MCKVLGIAGIVNGAISLVIGFLVFFAVISHNFPVWVLVVPLSIFVIGALLVAYGRHSVSAGNKTK
jgi:hypothetical protein